METKFNFLKEKSQALRKDIIDTIYNAGSGHPGGSLSVVDILTVLYYSVMNIDSSRPKDENRDRLVLSKGHVAPALYCVLADKGFFDKKELKTLRKPGSILQGHPDMKKTPGIEISTGSLGQGLSAANGMALAARVDNKSYNVFAILGDGEIQEGQIWEAAMTAAHYKLNKLIAIVDSNGLQIDGPVCEVMGVEPIDEKFRAFGWDTIVIDGHNHEEIYYAVALAKKSKEKPTAIIAKTVKGKGVSFMENCCEWHGHGINKEQAAQALADLGVR
ncbi:transketolase [Ruminiclostridium sufflavum]|nr:transketolase [Ruminiclostridium sufflavum]